MSEDRFSLKDHLFNREKVTYLAALLVKGVPGLDEASFVEKVMASLPDLELKQRIDLIANVLTHYLDDDFEVAARQILRSLPPPLNPDLEDDDFGDFIMAPLGRFVETHGRDHFETSVDLLRDVTKRFSMEGPIRAFIEDRPTEMLDIYSTWVTDENYHVRRLVSESTRPLLPWAPRISLEVSAPLPLLDNLHTDSTRYVTRSVANHLNDISKIEPSLVIDRLTSWKALGQQEAQELAWMTKHALRTLLKKGDAQALHLLGYSPDPKVEGTIAIKTPVVSPGQFLEFEVELVAPSDEQLVVDYHIDFVKKDGSRRPKVYKLRRLEVSASEPARLAKRHPLRANATTYTLYPGEHRVTVVANGKALATGVFELET